MSTALYMNTGRDTSGELLFAADRSAKPQIIIPKDDGTTSRKGLAVGKVTIADGSPRSGLFSLDREGSRFSIVLAAFKILKMIVKSKKHITKRFAKWCLTPLALLKLKYLITPFASPTLKPVIDDLPVMHIMTTPKNRVPAGCAI